MSDVHISLPPALRRALDLLVDPPADPDVSKGYLDLLGAGGDEAVAKNTGAIQAAWASPIGSMLYDNAQAISRRLISAWQHPVEWLNIPPGGTALDVGSGPGNVTASLARAAGPGRAGLGCRHLRADASPRGPRGIGTTSGFPTGRRATTSVARQRRCDYLILCAPAIPDPAAALAEMARVLRQGGKTGDCGPHRRRRRGLEKVAQRRGPSVRRRRNR